MSQDTSPLDPALTAEEGALVAQLSSEQIAEIDQALLSATGKHWRKVAMVVVIGMGDVKNRVIGIPDIYYSHRDAILVEQGKLEAQGNLRRMRYSEVRVP